MRLYVTIIYLVIFATPILSIEYFKLNSSRISPNLDGIDDYLEISLAQKLKNIKNWKIEIRSDNKTIVKSYFANLRKEKLSKFSFFTNENKFYEKNKIIFPKKIIWNCKNELGNTVKNGSYTLFIFVDLKENTIEENFPFEIDFEPPILTLKTEQLMINPNKKYFEQIKINQAITGESTDTVFGKITDSKNEIIQTFSWEKRNFPKTLIWDGKSKNNEMVSEGLYEYEVTARDFFNNSSSSKISPIIVTNQHELDIFAEKDVYYLNQPILFRMNYSIPKDFKNFVLNIYKNKSEEKNIIFKHEEMNKNFTSFSFESEKLKKGNYYYKLILYTTKGEIKESFIRNFKIIEDKVKSKIRISPKLFTPDEDWRKDLLKIEIKQSNNRVNSIQNWKLDIFDVYPENKELLIQSISGNHVSSPIYWDGIKNNSKHISSLRNLKFKFSFYDSFGNLTHLKNKLYKTGILLTKKESGYSVTISEFIFSKNQNKIVNNLKKILKKLPGYKIEIRSHKNQLGDDDENMFQSEIRSKKIFQKIFGKNNSNKNYSYRGYGELDLISNEIDNFSLFDNQRVEVCIIP